MIQPSPVLASPSVTCGTNASLFDGWYGAGKSAGDPHEPEGVSANLRYQAGSLCPYDSSSGNRYSSWVMIQGYGQASEYIQVGFLYYAGIPGNCERHFSEYNNNFSAAVVMLGACISPGELHFVKTQYIANGDMQSFVDSTMFQETSFHPFASWARPLEADFFGEVHYPSSNVPGSSSAPTDWSSMQIQRFSDNAYENTCGNITLQYLDQNVGAWNTTAPSCNHVEAWTR